MKVFVIGSGSWGTAVGNVLADNGVETMIWGRNPQEVEDISVNHRNSRFFEDTALNPELKATTEFSRINEFDTVILAVPSHAVKATAVKIRNVLTRKIRLVNLAKGFDPETHIRLSEEVQQILNDRYLVCYAALLGPSHAEEVIKRMQTTINIVCEDEEQAIILQKALSNEYFRVYRNDDMIGCEYAAGLKNIIAIASGILYGLELGDNAKASLMTRGLAEMSRYGLKKGARPETFMGLCGMGDLIVTCTSVHSRNWQAGYQIGKADSAAEFWRTNTKTVEGINACRIIYEEAQREKIPMPITAEVYQVLFENKKPSEAMLELMTRQLKAEI